MMDDATFAAVIARANLAPSVHNIQPARWRRDGDSILIAADMSLGLSVGDPKGLDTGVSCGAATEATLLALGHVGLGADVSDRWDLADSHTWPGHRIAARLDLRNGTADPLHRHLENRFTWRGEFAAEAVDLFGWSRDDAVLVLDCPKRDWLADRNDWASLDIMRDKAFRTELLSWMRLSPAHPRYAYDGLNRDNLRMDAGTARAAKWALGPLWPVLNLLGLTGKLTAEAATTRSAPVIACFHRAMGESPVTSGRAYLRMCLEAASLGLAGWPMAALSDHPVTAAEIVQTCAIPPDRRLVQVIRFGTPTGDRPMRTRRPIVELAP